jgi:hypothetical protein
MAAGFPHKSPAVVSRRIHQSWYPSSIPEPYASYLKEVVNENGGMISIMDASKPLL